MFFIIFPESDKKIEANKKKTARWAPNDSDTVGNKRNSYER